MVILDWLQNRRLAVDDFVGTSLCRKEMPAKSAFP
jgi:hypothetical protein